MCIASITDLTANMVEPRVLTPRERLEALLMAASIDERVEACGPQQPALRSLLESSAVLLRKLAT